MKNVFTNEQAKKVVSNLDTSELTTLESAIYIRKCELNQVIDKKILLRLRKELDEIQKLSCNTNTLLTVEYYPYDLYPERDGKFTISADIDYIAIEAAIKSQKKNNKSVLELIDTGKSRYSVWMKEFNKLCRTHQLSRYEVMRQIRSVKE